ncbi:unnamed protein product [Brassica oleracea var. botrytis]
MLLENRASVKKSKRSNFMQLLPITQSPRYHDEIKEIG